MALDSAKFISQQKDKQSQTLDFEEKSGFEGVLKSGINFLNEEKKRRRTSREEIENLIVNYSNNKALSVWEEKFRLELLKLFMKYFFIDGNFPLKEFLVKVERSIIIRTLSRFNGNQRDAAKFLGLKHTTLNEKLKKHNLRFQKRTH